MNKEIKKYIDALKRLGKKADEAIKNYGKELNMVAICKNELKAEGYDVDDVDDIDNLDVLEEYLWDETYVCRYTDKHGSVYDMRILKARYNNEKDDIEVYLKDVDGYLDEDWFPISYVDGEDQVYMAILDFLDRI